jgi:hypothetical protein
VNLAFDAAMFDRDPAAWTALDQIHPNLVTSWTVDRGRQYELDRTEGGRATVELLDPDGVMDPMNPSSPYMSTLNQINPLIQVVLCRRDPMAGAWEPRFRGFVSDLNYTVDPSQKVTRVTLELVDLFEILGGVEMQPGEFGDPPVTGSEGQIFFGPADQMGVRVDQVLDNFGLPAGYRVVFSGNVALTKGVYSPGESPLTVIQEAVDAEFPGVGNAYVDRIRHGRLSVHGRYARFDPSAVIGTPGAELWDWHHFAVGDLAAVEAASGGAAQLRTFSFNRGVSKLINHASAYPQWIPDSGQYRPPTDAEIAGQIFQDTTSIGRWGKRSWSSQNLLTESGYVDGADGLTETLRFAQYYVTNYAQPRNRIVSVGFRSIMPGRIGSATTWQLMSRIDISDQVDITLGHPGGGGFFDAEYYVEGVHETSRPLNPDYDDDTVTLDLSPKAYFDDTSMFPTPP